MFVVRSDILSWLMPGIISSHSSSAVMKPCLTAEEVLRASKISSACWSPIPAPCGRFAEYPRRVSFGSRRFRRSCLALSSWPSRMSLTTCWKNMPTVRAASCDQRSSSWATANGSRNSLLSRNRETSTKSSSSWDLPNPNACENLGIEVWRY